MKFPEDVQQMLMYCFHSKHREWLTAIDDTQWPLQIKLGLPTEQKALSQVEYVQKWIAAWQIWCGVGNLLWCERRWKTLGSQRLPEKLILNTPVEVAKWIGESVRWEQANTRYQKLTATWPVLEGYLSRYFAILADYSDEDFKRLYVTLTWICAHPKSHFYPRQLPVMGVDSKWLEARKSLFTDLIAAIQADTANKLDFYQRCGLKPLPILMRLRILDPALQKQMRGISDITAPVEEIAKLNFSITHVFIIENLQTGLAIPTIPNTVVLIGLGYHVDLLARIPWIASAKCIYWGDLDTHGFAILNRARQYLTSLVSVLMDEDTLQQNKLFWVHEPKQSSALALAWLTASEKQVYCGLKQQRWGQNIRLEQERIPWDFAWKKLISVKLE